MESAQTGNAGVDPKTSQLKTVRIGVASLNQTPLDLDGNVRRIVETIRLARGNGVQLLVFPELAVSGYGCEDAFFKPDFVDRCLDRLVHEIAPATEGQICAVGLPISIDGAIYNAVAVIADRRILGINAKRRLPRDGVHYEPRWFRPWSDARRIDIEIAGQSVPFGDLVYEVNHVRIALEICEEAWGAVPAAATASGFADIVLNPSASHFSLGKYEMRESLVANNSRSFGVYYAYSNPNGLEAGRIIYDGGSMIACDGRVLTRGRRFFFTETDIAIHDARIDVVRSSKMRKGAFIDGAAGPAALNVVRASAAINAADGPPAADPSSRIDMTGSASEEIEFLRASCLGLFDYLRKSGAKGYALSLSGGCDSSVCAVLVAQMFHFAVQELGLKQFSHLTGITAPSVETLLLCVWQGTSQSSAATLHAARSVATAIGASFVEIDIQPAVNWYVEAAEKALGRPLDWSTDDLTLQNIQARARAPMVWLLANAKRRLLITTANRSEAAVGYTTMDGDSAGGVAPLAGVSKAFLLRWARWAAEACTIGIGHVDALSEVLKQPPSAELRPVANGQTDEGDLMPYEVMESIECCRVRDKLSFEQTVDFVVQRHSTILGNDLCQAESWVHKFDHLWKVSQWKRERFAPSFHLDDFSVDSKTFCRYPIFSGQS